MESNTASVRVIARVRPARSQLLRHGGQGTLNNTSVKEDSSSTSTPSKDGAKAAIRKGGTDLKSGGAGKSTPSSSASASSSSSDPASSFVVVSPDGKSCSISMDIASLGNTKDSSRSKPYNFTFDQILGPESTQTEAFEAIADQTVKDVLKGYNGSIFAYGQTGSGKTHTMFGPPLGSELRGVIPRCTESLFSGINDSEELEEVTIKISFLEIYREAIRDLLNPKATDLRIREAPSGEVYVQNLSDEYVSSPEDILTLLSVGEKHRTVAATDMNEVSSRSHSVLIIVVNQKLKDGSTRVGKLNLADLAGSERIERTNAKGTTLEEAKMINQSLSSLGNCINALTDSKRSHVPFRDSILTFLLKDSLGGNTKTTLLVCCSGEVSDLNETLTTLNFAKRAKKIKMNVSVNKQLGVKELMSMVEELRKQLSLRDKQIIALQKTVKILQSGGTVEETMLNALLAPIGTGGVERKGGKAKTGTAALAHLEAALAAAGEATLEEDELDEEDDASHLLTPAMTSTDIDGSPMSTNIDPIAPSPLRIGTQASSDSKEEIPSFPDQKLAEESLSAPPLTESEEKETNGLTVSESGGTVRASSAAGSIEEITVKDKAPLPTEAWSASSSSSTASSFASSTSSNSSSTTAAPATVAPTPLTESTSVIDPELSSTPASSRPRNFTISTTESASSAYSTGGLHPPGSPHTTGTTEAKLASAYTQIDELKRKLAEERSHYRKKSQSWHLENAQLRVEKEMLRVSARAGDAMINNLATAVKNRSSGGVSSSGSSGTAGTKSSADGIHSPPAGEESKVLQELLAKNERLEKQMSEMKDTWSAYLDLILENQKQASSRRSAAAQAAAAASGGGAGDGANKDQKTKIVRPVRRKASFFSSLFNGGKSTSSAASGSTSSTSSAVPLPPSALRSTRIPTSASPPHSRPDSAASSPRNQPSSNPSSSTTSPSVPISSASSGRSMFESVLKRGYLYKKPVGWTLSLTRSWRKRLFLLRPNCIDYYDISDIRSYAAAGGNAGVTASSAAAAAQAVGNPPAFTGVTSPSTDSLAAHSGSLSSSSSFNALPSSSFLSPNPNPEGVVGSLRGTIALEADTSVAVCEFKDAQFGFEIATRDKHAKLHAVTAKDRDEWVEAIAEAVMKLRNDAIEREGLGYSTPATAARSPRLSLSVNQHLNPNSSSSRDHSGNSSPYPSNPHSNSNSNSNANYTPSASSPAAISLTSSSIPTVVSPTAAGSLILSESVIGEANDMLRNALAKASGTGASSTVRTSISGASSTSSASSSDYAKSSGLPLSHRFSAANPPHRDISSDYPIVSSSRPALGSVSGSSDSRERGASRATRFTVANRAERRANAAATIANLLPGDSGGVGAGAASTSASSDSNSVMPQPVRVVSSPRLSLSRPPTTQ